MNCFASHQLLFHVILFVASQWACHGQVVLGQWDFKAGGIAPTGTNGMMRWESPQGVALGFLTNWVEEAGALVNTGGNNGAGLYPVVDTNCARTVNAGVLVVKPETFFPRMTLCAGEHVARLANGPNGGKAGRLDTVGPAENVRVWRNGVEGAPLRAGESQIVSFVLPEGGMPLGSCVVLGDPGVWPRTWMGGVQCVVLLGDGEGGENLEAMVRDVSHALAVRYKIKGVPAGSGGHALKAANFRDYDGLWRTLFLVK